MKEINRLMMATVMGLAALFWLWMLVGWQVTLAVFLFVWANNIGQKSPANKEEQR